MKHKFKAFINRIVNSELIVVFTGLAIFFKGWLFYKTTFYQSVGQCSSDIIVRSFIFSMFLVTFLMFLKGKIRFFLAMLLNLALSILMCADSIYYGYSTSLLSVAQISNLKYGEQISSTIGDLISIGQALYFVDIFLILLFLIFRIIKLEKQPKRRWKPAIIYSLIMVIIYSTTIKGYLAEADEYRYNKKQQVEAGTVYAFHYLDIKSNTNLKKTAKYTNKSDVMNAYKNLEKKYSSTYSDDVYGLRGLAKNKNVILLQLESYQTFFINKKINGKEITPNLNKFLNENVKINNMMIQSYSTTADSEHSVISSLYPLENGMAFAQYSSNSYDDIFKIYKQAGYYNIYMHGNDGSFWNRNNVYGPLQIDELDFIQSFDENSELINDWISDEALYRQAVQKLTKVEHESFFANIVASSSHTAYDLPGIENKYNKVSIDVGEWKDSYFGNYLEAINYSDYAFGIFIDELKKENLYDDTVIFVFGDHYGLQMYNDEMLNYIEQTSHKLTDVETEINYINVLCGVHIPGISNMEINKTVSKLDIKPTLAYLSGIEDGFALGSNIFGNKDFACLNNGIIVTDKYYYNAEWFSRQNGEKIDMENVDEELRAKLNQYVDWMNEELNISNAIILNNLLK